jgi:general secretion pathway protein J
MVSIAILAVIGSLIYGAFDGMRRSRESITRTGDRYHEGRSAIARMSRELTSAFISLHRPEVTSQYVRQTLFVGTTRSPVDRVDFTSFSHRRTGKGTHESDQQELSYFGSRDPDTGAIDLVRRMSANIDEDARRGGVVQVLVHDVASVDFAYLDPMSNTWVEDWDSTQASHAERLPSQVRIVLALNQGTGQDPLVFTTKVALGMQAPIGLDKLQAALGQLNGGAGSTSGSGGGSVPPGALDFLGNRNPFAAGANGRRQGPGGAR